MPTNHAAASVAPVSATPAHPLDDAPLLSLHEIYQPKIWDRTTWTPKLEAIDHGLTMSVAAEDWAAVMQALERVIDQAPDRLAQHGAVLQEAILSLLITSWGAGLHVGYATARHDAPAIIMTTETVCDACGGRGRLWAGQSQRPDGAPAEAAATCGMCAGTGTQEAVTLAPFHPRRAVTLPDWLPDPQGMSRTAWLMAVERARPTPTG